MRDASQDKVGIYLVTANPLLREALARALFAETEFAIIGTCEPNSDAPDVILASGANLVLLDDFVPARSDLKLLRKLLAKAPSLQVILIGMPEKEMAFLDSVRAGAVGYVLHDASPAVFISSVRDVLNGEAACPSGMIFSLYKYYPGDGIAFPKFTRKKIRLAFKPIAAPRALHFYS